MAAWFSESIAPSVPSLVCSLTSCCDVVKFFKCHRFRQELTSMLVCALICLLFARLFRKQCTSPVVVCRTVPEAVHSSVCCLQDCSGISALNCVLFAGLFRKRKYHDICHELEQLSEYARSELHSISMHRLITCLY